MLNDRDHCVLDLRMFVYKILTRIVVTIIAIRSI